MVSDNRADAPHAELDGRRLSEIPTDELCQLAKQFHALTVRMYEELCIRRTAQHVTLHLEQMLHDPDEGTV